MHVSHFNTALRVNLIVPMHALEGLVDLLIKHCCAQCLMTAWFTSKNRCCLLLAAGCGT